MEKEYYDAQVKYINEIRSIRHDIQAHMIVLQYYLESENYDKARAYLSDMKKHQNLEQVVMKDTGHDLVNAIVSDTLSRAQRKIDFEMTGMLPADFVMAEYDMCTLFSNLFSNACEACEKLEYRKPVISMDVSEAASECKIVIRNPIEWKIETDNGRFVTSKEDKRSHGYGTGNMIRVVQQYHGQIDFLVTEGYFCVEITLNNKKE
ncbi:MAG: GHKL domain-containing protein [Agathobacter sp.]|nr:GHKL domain-containing protein [Agathobacter sp.]